MSLGFQDFERIFIFWNFCKKVNDHVSGAYDEKVEFLYNCNEIMKNIDLTSEQKTRKFFTLNLFHKDR